MIGGGGGASALVPKERLGGAATGGSYTTCNTCCRTWLGITVFCGPPSDLYSSLTTRGMNHSMHASFENGCCLFSFSGCTIIARAPSIRTSRSVLRPPKRSGVNIRKFVITYGEKEAPCLLADVVGGLWMGVLGSRSGTALERGRGLLILLLLGRGAYHWYARNKTRIGEEGHEVVHRQFSIVSRRETKISRCSPHQDRRRYHHPPLED